MNSATGEQFEAILDDLKQTDPVVRISAIKRLGVSRDPRAVAVLIQQLDAKEAPIRSQAVTALAQLRDPQAIGPLIGILRTDSSGVARKAVTALSKFSDPVIVPVLIGALDSPYVNVNSAAAVALGRLRASAAVPKLMALIAKISAVGAHKAMPHDRAALGMYYDAIKALGLIKDTQAIPALLQAFSDDSDPDIYLIDALAEFGQTAVPFLRTALSNKNGRVRAGAIATLTRLQQWKWIATILPCLKDRHGVVRLYAAIFLGQSGDLQAIPALVETLETTYSYGAEALLQLGEAGKEALLARLLSEPMCKNAQIYATIGYLEIDLGRAEPMDGRFITVLISALECDKERVRTTAAEALTKIRRRMVKEGDVRAASLKLILERYGH